MTTPRYYDESYPPSVLHPTPPPPVITGAAGADHAAVEPSDVFTIAPPQITASNPVNAAKLGPLGFVVALPAAWTAGQSFTVDGFAFSWNGAAFAPGAVPADEEPETEPEQQQPDEGSDAEET